MAKKKKKKQPEVKPKPIKPPKKVENGKVKKPKQRTEPFEFDVVLDVYDVKNRVRIYPNMKQAELNKLSKKKKDRIKGKKPKK